MNSSVGIPGRKRAVKPQGGTSPKTIVCELGDRAWCRENPLLKTLFEADSDPVLMGQTSLKSDTLFRATRPKPYREMPCQYYVVSKLFCIPGYCQQKLQRGMSTEHVQAITCVKNNCVKNGVHFPNKIVQLWTALDVACVLNKKLTRSRQGFELRTATFGNLRKLSEPLRESSATNVWTLVL